MRSIRVLLIYKAISTCVEGDIGGEFRVTTVSSLSTVITSTLKAFIDKHVDFRALEW
jgi:hypothetical protein